MRAKRNLLSRDASRTATEIRKLYGIEAAQVTFGHANANVTQVDAERDLKLAAKIMREVG